MSAPEALPDSLWTFGAETSALRCVASLCSLAHQTGNRTAVSSPGDLRVHRLRMPFAVTAVKELHGRVSGIEELQPANGLSQIQGARELESKGGPAMFASGHTRPRAPGPFGEKGPGRGRLRALLPHEGRCLASPPPPGCRLDSSSPGDQAQFCKWSVASVLFIFSPGFTASYEKRQSRKYLVQS